MSHHDEICVLYDASIKSQITAALVEFPRVMTQLFLKEFH